MLRSHRFACISAGLAAGWLVVAACSETGTGPLPDGTSPTQPPFPDRPSPKRDVLMLPGALNPAYQIDDNGVILNGAGQGDNETPIDQEMPGAQITSDAGPPADPASGETTPSETTPPETTPPEE